MCIGPPNVEYALSKREKTERDKNHTEKETKIDMKMILQTPGMTYQTREKRLGNLNNIMRITLLLVSIV